VSRGYIFLLIENALEGTIWRTQIWFGYTILAKMTPKLAPTIHAQVITDH
jgi:hypothetical protein